MTRIALPLLWLLLACISVAASLAAFRDGSMLGAICAFIVAIGGWHKYRETQGVAVGEW